MFKLSNHHSGRNFASTDRDKIMIGFVVVALIAAATILFFYFKPTEQGVATDGFTAFECVNPSCGNKWTMTDEDTIAEFKAMDLELRSSMADGIRFKCPKCNDERRTGLKGFACPKCGKSIVDPAKKAMIARKLGFRVKTPPPGPIACPHCGLDDVEKYWKQMKGSSKGK